jgi:hypothetical protein
MFQSIPYFGGILVNPKAEYFIQIEFDERDLQPTRS